MKLHHPRLAALASLSLALALSAVAQTAGTGTITGHVYNPVNKEFVRDAEVHVAGTNITVATEDGGYFSLARVPAGKVTLTVTYTGFAPVAAEVDLPAGGTATHEFDLATPAAAATAGKDVLQLETLVVTTVKDGNAKALQHQRNSMNLSRSVSSEAFGNVTEGNVGEFLKYLPGVELEYTEADTRGPRLGGMSSEYASVTLDGKTIASADSFGQYVGFENSPAGTANRSFGFDSISINSIESIEINRVTPASMDADAPAGNINLKTKRAFDQKGRRVSASLSTVFNSEEVTLQRTLGPDDSKGLKYKPNYNLGYSDVFLNNRLGIVLSVQESNLYNEQYRVDHNYNRTPAGTDTRGQVLTSVLLKDGPKWTERASYGLTADFKASPNLTLSLTTLFARYHAQFYNRQVTMTAGGTRATEPGDGVLSYGTATGTGGSITLGGGNGDKFTNTLTLSPSFEYRKENLSVDGAFTSSHSRNDYDNLAKGTLANSTVNNITGIGFTAARSSSDGADWRFTQTGGPDWSDLSLQKNPRISDDNRQNTIDIKSGELNARYALPLKLPTFLQVGGKWARDHQTANDTRSYDVWQFIGPGGGTTGSFANYPSPFVLFQGDNQPHVSFTSIGGAGAPAFPDRDTLGTLFHSHPEYFLRSLPTSATVAGSSGMTLANYESGVYLNKPTYDMIETISAGYVMANTRISKLQLQGGVRFERTALDSLELDPYSNQQVAAAGYPVTSAGAPNSVSAIDYKYSKPRVHRHASYDDLFPSLSAKYTITPNLLFDLGWGKTIKRPNISNIAGTRQIDDNTMVVTTPNPKLLPERSQKVAAALSYFFGNSGINNVQLVATRTRTENQTLAKQISDVEYGNTDPQLAGYEFKSFTNASSPVTWNALEFSYQQYLSFLPRLLQGTSITASYTRVDVETQPGIFIAGVVPNSVKGTLSYKLDRVGFSFSAIWSDDSGPWLNNLNRYQKANTKCDFSAGYRLSDRFSLFIASRNVFQQSHRIMEKSAGNPDVLYRYENYGTNWTIGIKGDF
ncbi:MAG TPA: TonB-dependent receptor [Lacunisphaera sp.]|jgi:TonB-dependent receptor|nr:TonB-dependent receptor [Lacunisphaera sp.]